MMYITVKQAPRVHQITLEELLSGVEIKEINDDRITNTVTYKREQLSPKFEKRLMNSLGIDSYWGLLDTLKEFNKKTEFLRECDREQFYTFFFIPKSKGGWRKISAPKEELMKPLRELKEIFEEKFNAMYYTSAYAYVKKRSVYDCVSKHKESMWFMGLDLHDFFGSTTLDFVMEQFSMIYPFCKVMELPNGEAELRKALELGFLNGGLPQGTPLSPTVTNIMMIPIDAELNKKLRHKFVSEEDPMGTSYVFTRYADDFQISSKYKFKFKVIERMVINTLKEFGAPFTLNQSKTKFGSRAGRNWMLGLMLNKDGEITVGAATKRRFKAAVYQYAMAKTNDTPWSLGDVQILDGQRSYYSMIEGGEKIDGIIKHISEKVGFDIRSAIKKDLKCLVA